MFCKRYQQTTLVGKRLKFECAWSVNPKTLLRGFDQGRYKLACEICQYRFLYVVVVS